MTFECFNGLIEDGLVIDHKTGVKTDNSLQNLQAVTQSENLKKGRTGMCKLVGKRAVQSFDTITHEKEIFKTMYAAAKYFDIYPSSVRLVAEGIRITAASKLNQHKIQFQYITPSGDYSCVDIITKV